MAQAPRLPSVVLVALVLAGCSGGSTPGPAEADGGPRASGDLVDALAAFRGTDCVGRTAVVYVPGPFVAAELPDGYVPAQAFGTPLNNPHLWAVRCATLVVGNATLTDVAVATTGTLLDDGDYYRWEVFVEDAGRPLVELLKEAGWNARTARIDIGADQVRVEADGIRYVADLPVPPETHDKHDAALEVYHHLGADGVPRTMRERLDKAFYGNRGVSGVRLEASGGALGNVSQRMGAPFTTGLTTTLVSDWSVELHQDPTPRPANLDLCLRC